MSAAETPPPEPSGPSPLTGRRAPLLPGEGWRGLVFPLLAVGLAVVAFERETSMKAALDPVAFACRALAVAFLLRGFPAVLVLGRRLRLTLGAGRHRLSLSPERLRLETPAGERNLAREDIVAIHLGEGHGPLDLPQVWLVHRPDPEGRALLPLPPVFDDSAAALHARLERWRGPLPAIGDPEFPKPARLGSKVYDEAARGGRVPPGTARIRHGLGWLRRMPFAAVLAALVFLDGALRTPDLDLGYLGLLPIAGVMVCALIPLGWIVVAMRHVRPRKGLALVATPAEVLMRTRHGILRASWDHLESIRITQEPTLTILEGWSQRRRMVLVRDGDRHPIRYDEAFLGVPADAAVALLESYRAGRMDPRLR